MNTRVKSEALSRVSIVTINRIYDIRCICRDIGHGGVSSSWNDLQRSAKVISNVIVRRIIYDFLLASVNCVSVLCRYRDITRHWSKIVNFSYQTRIWQTCISLWYRSPYRLPRTGTHGRLFDDGSVALIQNKGVIDGHQAVAYTALCKWLRMRRAVKMPHTDNNQRSTNLDVRFYIDIRRPLTSCDIKTRSF